MSHRPSSIVALRSLHSLRSIGLASFFIPKRLRTSSYRFLVSGSAFMSSTMRPCKKRVRTDVVDINPHLGCVGNSNSSKQTTNRSEQHQRRIFLSDSLSWYTHTRLGGVLRDSSEAATASSALASTGSTSSDFVTLTREVEWLQRDVVIFGKKVPQPRLIQYMADDVRLAYRYSGCDLVPVKFHPIVLQAKEQAETLAGVPRGYFNSCLLNRYRDGKDSNGWHADDEPLYGRDPIIASVSYGAARDFDIKRKADGPPEKARLRLCDKDVLIMGGAMQRNYLHCIPKRANSKVDGERINLTFRRIVKPM